MKKLIILTKLAVITFVALIFFILVYLENSPYISQVSMPKNTISGNRLLSTPDKDPFFIDVETPKKLQNALNDIKCNILDRNYIRTDVAAQSLVQDNVFIYPLHLLVATSIDNNSIERTLKRVYFLQDGLEEEVR